MGNSGICGNGLDKPLIDIRSDCCKGNEQSYSITKCAHCNSMIKIPRETENEKKEKQIINELI